MHVILDLFTDHPVSLSLYTLKLSDYTISGTTQQDITIVQADRDKGMYPQLTYIYIYICGGGVRSILLLPLVARCLETIDVCMYMAHVCFMSVVVTV